MDHHFLDLTVCVRLWKCQSTVLALNSVIPKRRKKERKREKRSTDKVTWVILSTIQEAALVPSALWRRRAVWSLEKVITDPVTMMSYSTSTFYPLAADKAERFTWDLLVCHLSCPPICSGLAFHLFLLSNERGGYNYLQAKQN